MRELNFPENLLYHPEHTWLRIETDGAAYVGISDFAQNQLGEVAYVDLPTIGAHYAAGDEFGSVESIKAVNALFMPLNGTVTDVNNALADAPSTVNASPYGDGWMLKIKIDANAEKLQLLDSSAYQTLLKD